MIKEKKLVALSAVLPVLADFIEDLNDQFVFKQDLKRKANILAEEIRKVDYKVLQVYGEKREEIYEQQVQLQLLFRQWIEELERQIPTAKIGRIGDGLCDIQDITVGIYKSVYNRRDELSENFSMILVVYDYQRMTLNSIF